MLVSHQKQGASLWGCSANSLALRCDVCRHSLSAKISPSQVPLCFQCTQDLGGAEFSPAEKTLYRIPPPPPADPYTADTTVPDLSSGDSGMFDGPDDNFEMSLDPSGKVLVTDKDAPPEQAPGTRSLLAINAEKHLAPKMLQKAGKRKRGRDEVKAELPCNASCPVPPVLCPLCP